jgi:hypothetical protein
MQISKFAFIFTGSVSDKKIRSYIKKDLILKAFFIMSAVINKTMMTRQLKTIKSFLNA